MRISDHRYNRDVRKYNLALRLVGHEARTGTIRHWTGLSGEGVRNLFQSYALNGDDRCVTRRRGPSPHNVEFSLLSPQMRADVAILTSVLLLLDVMPVRPMQNVRTELPSLGRGERLCAAYECFRELIPESTITLEHAVLLMTTLVQGRELIVAKCACCGALMVARYHGDAAHPCDLCSNADDGDPTITRSHMLSNRRQMGLVRARRLMVRQHSDDQVIQHQGHRATDRQSHHQPEREMRETNQEAEK